MDRQSISTGILSVSTPDVHFGQGAEGRALAEVSHAYDEQHADGVVLLSNARGRYLGDETYEPLWADLDARAAMVFIQRSRALADPMRRATLDRRAEGGRPRSAVRGAR
jgi:hypothetical protein